MPTYAYKCQECGWRMDVVKKLAEIDSQELCPHGHSMQRQISAVRIAMDYAGYSCPVTGDWIEGKRAHQENLKKHGCRILEPGEREATAQRRRAEDAALDAAVDHTVEGFVHALPEAKREQLRQEIAAGADLATTRESPGITVT